MVLFGNAKEQKKLKSTENSNLNNVCVLLMGCSCLFLAMLHESATQEQQQIIDTQQKEIELLKSQLEATEDRLT